MLGRLRGLFGGQGSEPPVALVLLESEPRTIDDVEIASAVGRASGRPYAESSIRLEGGRRWRFVVDGFELTILPTDRPYLPQDREPSSVPQLREVIESQKAAILLDCWRAPRGMDRESGTGLMGRILVELFGEYSLGVYCFHTQRVNPIDPTLVGLFRRGEAREAMSTETYKRVQWVTPDDPKMEAAIREARERWPEFVRAFAERTPGSDGYGIKARFAQDDHVEHLWIEVQEADEEGATGRVLNGPVYLLRPRKGEWVRITLDELSDWAYLDGERRGGGFSDAVIP